MDIDIGDDEDEVDGVGVLATTVAADDTDDYDAEDDATVDATARRLRVADDDDDDGDDGDGGGLEGRVRMAIRPSGPLGRRAVDAGSETDNIDNSPLGEDDAGGDVTNDGDASQEEPRGEVHGEEEEMPLAAELSDEEGGNDEIPTEENIMQLEVCGEWRV